MQTQDWTGDGGQTQYLELTPALAHEWLTQHHFEGQRELHPGRVEAYAADMRHGLFGPSDFHFAVLRRADGSAWRPMMNGRHRAHSVVTSNCTIQARVHDIPIAKEADAGVVYSWFDVAGLRTTRDIMEAMGATISHRLLPAVQAACNLIQTGFEMIPAGSSLRVRSSTSLELKRQLIEEWGAYALAYLELLSGQSQSRQRILQRQNVMSVGMVTLRYDEARAVPFWSQLAANDGLRPGTPQHALMDLFGDRPSRAFQHYVWARLVAQAWNHYWDGNAVKIIRIGPAAMRAPILIKGTPYDGKTVRSYAFVDPVEDER